MTVYKFEIIGDRWMAIAIDGPPLDRNGLVIRVGDEVELASRERDEVVFATLRFVELKRLRHEVFPWRMRVVS